VKQISLLLFALIFSACGTSRKSINFDRVKEGKSLKYATEITPKTFINLWLQNHKKKSIYNLELLYQDTAYSYFGRYFFDKKTKKQKPKLFKVNTDSLLSSFPNYQKINGEEIRNLFYKHIVPEKDKHKWKNSKCNQKSSSQKYTYKTLSPDKIEITLNWIIKCGTSVIHNANYTGIYLLKQHKIIK